MSKEGQYVYEVAREFNMKTAAFRAAVQAHGFDWDVSHHMRRLTETQVLQFAAAQRGEEPVVIEAEAEQIAIEEAVDAVVEQAKQEAVESAEATIAADPSPADASPADPGPAAEAPTGLRVIKTHGTADVVPVDAAAKYLVVLRDPKEVLVSAYHFLLPLAGLMDRIDPPLWLRLFGSQGVSAWAAHSAGWWALRDQPNVCVLRFADMKADLPGAVDTVAAFMGVELTSTERAAVIERSGFQWMKAHNAQFKPITMPFFDPTTLPKMVRRGAVGGASELYDAEQLVQIDQAALKVIAKRGYELPYRELFDCVA